jgi:hypothetical protein
LFFLLSLSRFFERLKASSLEGGDRFGDSVSPRLTVSSMGCPLAVVNLTQAEGLFAVPGMRVVIATTLFIKMIALYLVTQHSLSK